jgi:RNA polymerase sigma factor (sigma-70 family)
LRDLPDGPRNYTLPPGAAMTDKTRSVNEPAILMGFGHLWYLAWEFQCPVDDEIAVGVSGIGSSPVLDGNGRPKVMREAPATRASLLVRLRDPRDDVAWARFVDIYGPLVYDYGRRHGLQDADAADLTQEVLRAVARSAGQFRYEPARGSFRSWLFTVARTKRINLGARESRQPRGRGGSDVIRQMDQVTGRDAAEAEAAEWERAFEQRLLDWAAGIIRAELKDSTWQAFCRTAFERQGAQQVAADLGLTVGAVYAAKSRVLARLREVVRQARFDSSDD